MKAYCVMRKTLRVLIWASRYR